MHACLRVTTGAQGAPAAALAAAAADDAAWTEAQRCAAWWLGEHVNAAAGERAGWAAPDQALGHGPADPGGEPEEEGGPRRSAAEAIALQAWGPLLDCPGCACMGWPGCACALAGLWCLCHHAYFLQQTNLV